MELIAPGNGGEWQDGNPAQGVDASVLTAAAIEHPMKEIIAAITAAGLTPDGANLAQLAAAIVALCNSKTSKLVFADNVIAETNVDGVQVEGGTVTNFDLKDPNGVYGGLFNALYRFLAADGTLQGMVGMEGAISGMGMINYNGAVLVASQDIDEPGKVSLQVSDTGGPRISSHVCEYARHRFYTSGTERVRILDGGLTPYVDNSIDLGSSGARWDDLYATNGTIQTSDGDLKTEIQDTKIGLNFINDLRPVEFKWINGGNVVTLNDTGELDPETGKIDPETGEVDPATMGPLMEEIVTATAGTRLHHGLIAQEVKAALDNYGLDAALYIDSGTSGGKGIRYNELIAPLIKAVQEQSTIIESLTARIATLEG